MREVSAFCCWIASNGSCSSDPQQFLLLPFLFDLLCRCHCKSKQRFPVLELHILFGHVVTGALQVIHGNLPFLRRVRAIVEAADALKLLGPLIALNLRSSMNTCGST